MPKLLILGLRCKWLVVNGIHSNNCYHLWWSCVIQYWWPGMWGIYHNDISIILSFITLGETCDGPRFSFLSVRHTKRTAKCLSLSYFGSDFKKAAPWIHTTERSAMLWSSPTQTAYLNSYLYPKAQPVECSVPWKIHVGKNMDLQEEVNGVIPYGRMRA